MYAVYTKRHPNKPKPVFQDRFFKLIDIGEHDPEYNLSLKYFDRTIPRLTNYIMIIWNAGEDTLLGSNISEEDPLVVEFEQDAEVLRVKVIETNETIQFEPLMVENKVDLKFNYMEPNQGVRLDILHTGKVPNPKIRGSIRGIPEGIIYFGTIPIPDDTNVDIPNIHSLENASKIRKTLASNFVSGLLFAASILYLLLVGFNWFIGWLLFFVLLAYSYSMGKNLLNWWKTRPINILFQGL
jgi:hypothetical protein